VPIVDGVSLSVGRGETVCVVGESGCGKSLTALSVLRLLDPPLFATGGRIRFGGVDLLRLAEPELRKVRGKRIAMIFQEPMTALNPVLTVGEQIVEVLTLHEGMSRKTARARAIELLGEVRLPAPARQVDAYPHVLSGGMRQRVMIAMALACGPELLIADEPTTALDVTVQAQILALLAELQERRGMSLLLITHDLGVVAETARRVAVMYAGRIVEEAPVRALFRAPQHPYTRALLRSLPGAAGGKLKSIPGQVPAPAAYPPGCRFHPRCDERFEPCAAAQPGWTVVGETRVACFAREAGE
jgi:peptide/nickel transport system ATP-binding protein